MTKASAFLILVTIEFCQWYSVAHSQTEASDYSRIGFAGFLSTVASDYQCVGINPANLGFVPKAEIWNLASPIGYGVEISKHSWAMTAVEGGLTLHSDALDKQSLMQMLTQTSAGTFDAEAKIRAATAFADKGVRFSADIITIGVSYQSDSWGGIALTMRERMSGTFRFNEAAASLAFEGRHFDYFDSLGLTFNGDTVGFSTNPQPFSQIFEDTRLAMLWFREIGASYGIGLLSDTSDFNVYLGFGVKYLMGYALIDATTVNGELKAYSALSPMFGISYGKATSPSFIAGNDYQHIGDGWGLDLGINIKVEKMNFAFSVVDIGQILWDGNVFQAKDTVLNGVTSTGFSSYNIFEEAQKITGDGNYFNWVGLNTTTTTLPARLRIGTSYYLSAQWRFGFDAIFPINTEAGSLGEPIVSAGADYRPITSIKIGVGFGGGGNMGAFIPISFMYSAFDGLWEIGVASRDVITYLVNDRPILSGVIGLARFRF